MSRNKLNIIIGALLIIDAVGSMIVQYQDAFFPFQVGRLYRVVVGTFMLFEYPIQKCLFDLSIAITGIIVALPLFLIIPLAIIAESGLPVLFKMERCGKDLRRFDLYHYRSMVKGKHKVANYKRDGRVTKVGRLLRATGLDSLPELFNVVKGDISLVGPRPMPYIVEDEPGYNAITDIPGSAKRSAVIPGMTGLAQIHSSKYNSRRIRYKYDNAYIDRACLWLDSKILLYSFWLAFKRGWD